MRVLSPAKINLHLRVGPPRSSDGFHPLLSWMCTVGLHDTLELTANNNPGIRLKCDRPEVPVDETNLILRAAKALSPTHGAEASLQKKIPLGGGLGGGSSNAAFALIAFNQLWNLNLSIQQLSQIASKLGSDVPFFLHGPSSVITNLGEHVTPIPRPAAKHAVLFFPKLSMSTPAVYRKFDEMNLGSQTAIDHHPDWYAWSKLPARELVNLLINDLEAPAFALCPDLANLRSNLEQKTAHPIRMSGSGSTLFTLTDHHHDAERIAAQIQDLSIRTGIFELSPPQ
jgi:4-diphosphocytidyl-2-C-methyl-D-erythritol kinase